MKMLNKNLTNNIMKQIIYEFIVTDNNNIETRTFISCKDELEAVRIKKLTLKSNGVINVEFKKQ